MSLKGCDKVPWEVVRALYPRLSLWADCDYGDSAVLTGSHQAVREGEDCGQRKRTDSCLQPSAGHTADVLLVKGLITNCIILTNEDKCGKDVRKSPSHSSHKYVHSFRGKHQNYLPDIFPAAP